MTPAEYLDAAKKAMSIESDGELARRLECPSGHVAEMRNGKRGVPLDVAYKLAITLKLDPAQVVADLEGQREKNEKRRAFWASFTSHARIAMLAAGLSCMLALNSFGISADDLGRLGGALAMTASAVYYLRRKDA